MALKPALLEIQLMCFDIAVTKMQAESKQRDAEDPRESDTHRELKKGTEETMEDKPEGQIYGERCREWKRAMILFIIKFMCVTA